MSQATLEAAGQAAPPAMHPRGNVLRLSVAQALAGANSTLVYAAAAIVGHTLAPSKLLATLPISVYVVGMAVCTLPAGAVARRYGRRAAFLTGTGCGAIAGLLSTLAILLNAFWLFCIGTCFGGAYGAVVLSYRFAAADCVPPERRARALAAVMAGGVFAGVIGPQLVTYTMELWQPYLFAATFLAQAAVAVLSALIVAGVRLPKPSAAEIVGGGRPLGVILREPRFIIAMICGTVAYMLMNFLMTTAPLAMRLCGISQSAANLGLQWHVIAMYAPSFFTGRLIGRFGAPRVVAVGLTLFAAAGVMGLTGTDVTHFWLSLILLGLGWNFSWLGASALVLECHRPEERTRVQSLNDFVVFGMMALGSFSAGGLLLSFGWDTVIWVSFLPLAAAVAALGYRAAARSRLFPAA
ncbi:MAG TPA: MFS transporter [Acetobacteraceae bacterium]|nr:MFS transporter [Acetobacteraceae bacterium]